MTTEMTSPTHPKVSFVRAKSEKPKSMVFALDGLPKSGKTEFSLSMPKPLCIHNFNVGLKGVIEKHLDKGEEIYTFDYEVPLTSKLPGSPTNLQEAGLKVWMEFAENFLASLTCMKSVVVDLSSEAWEVVRLARLGRFDKVMPIQYGNVNVEFRQLTQKALRSGVNVGFLHKVKPEYNGDQKTGNFERSGFGDIGYDVEATLLSSRDATKRGVDQFGITIAECRANSAANGQVFRGLEATFSTIASTIFPATTKEDWE